MELENEDLYYDQDGDGGEESSESLEAFDEEDEEDVTDDEEEEGEEEDFEGYSLPPLPPVNAPATVQGIPAGEVYSIIKELRRQLDDPVECDRAKAMLRGETNVLLAVAQVLQEAGLLRRPVVTEQGVVDTQLLPQPAAPTPALPTGYKSWILDDTRR